MVGQQMITDRPTRPFIYFDIIFIILEIVYFYIKTKKMDYSHEIGEFEKHLVLWDSTHK